jgi:hypothetical protein
MVGTSGEAARQRYGEAVKARSALDRTYHRADRSPDPALYGTYERGDHPILRARIPNPSVS